MDLLTWDLTSVVREVHIVSFSLDFYHAFQNYQHPHSTCVNAVDTGISLIHELLREPHALIHEQVAFRHRSIGPWDKPITSGRFRRN